MRKTVFKYGLGIAMGIVFSLSVARCVRFGGSGTGANRFAKGPGGASNEPGTVTSRGPGADATPIYGVESFYRISISPTGERGVIGQLQNSNGAYVFTDQNGVQTTLSDSAVLVENGSSALAETGTIAPDLFDALFQWIDPAQIKVVPILVARADEGANFTPKIHVYLDNNGKYRVKLLDTGQEFTNLDLLTVHTSCPPQSIFHDTQNWIVRFTPNYKCLNGIVGPAGPVGEGVYNPDTFSTYYFPTNLQMPGVCSICTWK